jgi:uncharacterized protein (TIGR03000 family)
MCRQRFALPGLLATAVTSLLLAGSPAAAQQQGWPLNQGAYNGFTQGSSYSAPSNFAPPAFFAPTSTPSVAPAAAPAASSTEVRSFYPSSVGDEYNALGTRSAGSRAVTVNVSVPAGAEIAFDGTKTAQTGARRAFVSPPLAAGQDYVYVVTAKWQEGGREVTKTRRITVHAGDVINLNF